MKIIKPKVSNVFAKNFEILVLLIIVLVLINSLKNETNYNDQIIKGTFLSIVFLIQINHFYRLFKEPTFITVHSDKIEIRPSFFIFKRILTNSEIDHFSIVERPYFLLKSNLTLNYKSYQINLKNGKTILLTEYYFLNFKEIKKELIAVGIPFYKK